MTDWYVTYDNRSQNVNTWESGTDELEADTMVIRDGHLKFMDADDDEQPVAAYAPGYWVKTQRRRKQD